MTAPTFILATAIEAIEQGGYTCEGGPLVNNAAWQAIKERCVWQPIETAPKDRLVILGWPAFDERHWSKVCFGQWGGMAWPSHFNVRAPYWMPFPSPPEARP